eukprot:TRINITY_DN1657_c0_g2_i3.p3 TRINITY_DN1657_c0_g2~~TRINITY_DN1657_c0_g2_i3.p3  ORF type:complete len:184 (+),score=80.91 TRINITY_DN1657_c0_g2_i3:87-638(+)
MGKPTVMLAQAHLRHYEVIGAPYSTAKNPYPKVYRLSCFAPNHVVAKTKFWRYMREYQKTKKTHGRVYGVRELHEKRPGTVKNFGVHLKYYSRTGPVNTSKEIRDTHLARAVSRIYNGLAGQHRARASNIQVISTCTKKAAECSRPQVTQFHDAKIRFPLIHRVRKPSKKARALFTAKAPQTF